MTGIQPQMDELIRHRNEMQLIERLLEASDEDAVSELRIGADSSFYLPGLGVPAYVGVEYMAQTIAAYDGAMQLRLGSKPGLGFLLGTRRFKSDRDYYVAGDHITVRVTSVFNDGEMASFECSLSVNSAESATASLNVYRPNDEADFFGGAGS